MKRFLFALMLAALAGCAHADCNNCGQVTAVGTAQGVWTTGVQCTNCFASAPVSHKLVDFKTAPAELPAYDCYVLLWTGTEWQTAYRFETDSEGEHWSTRGGLTYLSKQHPMWQPLPDRPKEQPVCSSTVKGETKIWAPKDGVCKLEDAK